MHTCHTAPKRIKKGIYRKFMHFKWRRDNKKTQNKTKGNQASTAKRQDKDKRKRKHKTSVYRL